MLMRIFWCSILSILVFGSAMELSEKFFPEVDFIWWIFFLITTVSAFFAILALTADGLKELKKFYLKQQLFAKSFNEQQVVDPYRGMPSHLLPTR
jgi:hypothetical protein